MKASVGQTLTASEHYTNRIHVDDCAGIICHLINLAETCQPLHAIYLGCDSSPVTQMELMNWLNEQLQLSITVHSEDDDQPLTKMGGNKRCSNQRIIDSGYEFIYGDYQTGFAQFF